jgi:DNA-binding Xre family transcriptional regulator
MLGMIRLKVKDIAEEKGITMTKLSHRSEISFNTVKSIFRNPYRTINTDTLERLAVALGVTPADLIEYIPTASQGQQGAEG